jgi:hypothetical protein
MTCGLLAKASIPLPGNKMENRFANPGEEDRSEEAVKASTFLSQFERTLRENGEDAAMRFVYRNFFVLRKSQDYGLCDRILDGVETNQLPPPVLIAMLTITAPLSTMLVQRENFYHRARRAIEDLRGPDLATSLLVGLEYPRKEAW